MGLPDNFTQITPDRPTRTRNTMLGNAWHFPSALWLLFLLLLTQTSAAIHTNPQQTHIRRPATIWLASRTPWGPPPTTHAATRLEQSPAVGSIQDPTADNTRLDPGLCRAIDQTTIILLPNVHQIRRRRSKNSMTSSTTFIPLPTNGPTNRLPHHCQKAYPQSIMIAQIPAHAPTTHHPMPTS